MRKKLIILMLISSMILTVTACSKDKENPVVTPTAIETQVTNTVTPTEEVKPTDEVTPTEVAEVTNVEDDIYKHIPNEPIEDIEIEDVNKYLDKDGYVVMTTAMRNFLYDDEGNIQPYIIATYNENSTISYTIKNSGIVLVYKMTDEEIEKYYDLIGQTIQIDGETGERLYPPITDEIKEQVKQTVLNNYNYTRKLPILNGDEIVDNGDIGQYLLEIIENVKNCYRIYNPNEIEELVREFYPYTEQEDVDFIVEYTLAKGGGIHSIKTTLNYLGLNSDLFDENSLDKTKMLKESVESLLNDYPAITKQNVYNALMDDGFNSEDALDIIDEYYIVLEEDALREAISKNSALIIALDLDKEENLKKYIQHYYEESTIDINKYVPTNTGC